MEPAVTEDESSRPEADLIYDAAFDERLWVPVMNRMADVVGGGANRIHPQEPTYRARGTACSAASRKRNSLITLAALPAPTRWPRPFPTFRPARS